MSEEKVKYFTDNGEQIVSLPLIREEPRVASAWPAVILLASGLISFSIVICACSIVSHIIWG